jgi:hypothetical protein
MNAADPYRAAIQWQSTTLAGVTIASSAITMAGSSLTFSA